MYLKRVNIYGIVFLLLSVSTLCAKSNAWNKLENVEMHPANAYHLKKHIDVLEMRSYYPGNKDFGYRPDIDIYVKPENKIDKKLLASFKKVKPNFSRKSNIAYPPDALGKTNRAFALYDDGKISRMNEISDVLQILEEIDTPAEAQLVLWLYAKHRKSLPKTLKGAKVVEVSPVSEKYRKVNKGYEILSKFNVYSTKPGTTFQSKSITASMLYHQTITIKSMINKKGKIVSFEQVQKSKITEEESTITSCASAME